MNTKTLTLMALASLATSLAQAQTTDAAAPAPAAATPEHSFTGNLALISDYRFRGISQTYKLPAVQGGLDYAHSSGLYAGTWMSNVSGNSYNNGAGLEWDLYGGYKFSPVQDVTLDLGALAYVYPGARLNSAPGVASDQKYNNVDVYAAVTAGAFNAKLSVAVTDYFGLNGTTAGYAYFSSLASHGGSKGSAYLDLNYSFDLGDGLSLATHLGRMEVKHYGELSYTDAKLALSKDLQGWTLTGALIGTDAKRGLYQVANSAGQSPKKVGTAGLLLSIGKTF
jgi:uncharacterized protein (TIGR02001 family)